MKRILVTSLMVLVVYGPASGDDSATPLIATDRPAVTDSSVVVPVGSFQAENGLAETANAGQQTIDGPETWFRLGVASKTELRLIAPDYFEQLNSSARPGSGFGDLTIGVKQQLGPTPGRFDASLIASLSLPTGAGALSSHGYDPSLQLPWSRALTPNWTAAGMLSVYWPTEGPRRNVTGECTFLFDRQLTKSWDAFVEYAGDFPENGRPRHLLHFGTAYRPTPRQQIDFHFGAGLSSTAVDHHLIGVGYSFRFQLFHH